MGSSSRLYRFGDFVLDPAHAELRRGQEPVALRPKSWDLLHYLVTHADQLISKDELMSALWPKVVVTDDSLTRCIYEVRIALGDAGPSAIQTVPRRGYRFTLAVQAQTLTDSATDVDSDTATAGMSSTRTMPTTAAASTTRPEPADPPPVPNNLPRPRTRFIGRERALADCARKLQDVRLLTLTGIGGCGKTRLALRLAEMTSTRFPDGVWFVDLAPLQDGGRVAAAVAAALDVKEEAGTPSVARIGERVRSSRLLLVLDNCEHVVEAVATLADALLEACGGLTLVATSRERLRVAGEQVFALEPLSLPGTEPEAAASGSEAVALFVDRARLAVPDFELDETRAAAVAEICRRLDGIALAIELAAARVGVMSVEDIAARLGDRFRLLTGGSRGITRHQALHTTLRWSFDSLSPAEQTLLCELTVFAGGCTLDAVSEVCGCDDVVALDHLTALHDKSLLIVDRSDRGGARYRLLETVRQYAQEQLEASGGTHAAKTRHLQHYVAMALRAAEQLQGPEQGLWMARLRREQDNLLAAHAWCAHAPGGEDAGLRLAGSLWRYWLSSAQLEQGYAVAQAALARAGESSDPIWRCRVMVALGTTAFRMGRYAESLRIGDRSLALARVLGDPDSVASCLSLRAKSLHATGDLPGAIECNEEACAIARGLGPSTRLSAALNNLAELHRGLGHVVQAERCYEESIAITRELRYAGGAFVSLCNLSRLLVGAGRLERARTMLLESLELWSSAGLRGLGKDLIEGAAGLAARLGDDAMAARLAGAAQARLEEAGIRREGVDEAFLAPLMGPAAARLGEAAFAAEQQRGRAAPYDDVIADLRAWLQAPPKPKWRMADADAVVDRTGNAPAPLNSASAGCSDPPS